MKTITSIEQQQLTDRLNKTSALPWPPIPRGGWVKATRKALGMSGAALSLRLGGSASMAANMQRREQNDSITLNNLREAAEAMGCRLVYAIVPPQGSSIEALIQQQAEQRALELLQQAAGHMALEAQSLNEDSAESERLRLTKEMVSNPPRDLWHPSTAKAKGRVSRKRDSND